MKSTIWIPADAFNALSLEWGCHAYPPEGNGGLPEEVPVLAMCIRTPQGIAVLHAKFDQDLFVGPVSTLNDPDWDSV